MGRSLSPTRADDGSAAPPRRQLRLFAAELTPAATVFVFLTGVTLWVALSKTSSSFYSPLGLFGSAVASSALPLSYPFLVVATHALGFSERLRKRWIFYTRPRTNLRRYLVREAAKGAVIAFTVFFAYIVVIGIVVFYVMPALGATFDESPPGVSVPPDAQLARLTELTAISPLLYIAGYAAWQGVNAAVWATVAFALLLLIRNRIIAFAVPFALFIVLGFIMESSGGALAWNAPFLLWVLWSIAQVSMVPSFIALGVFALCAIALTSLAVWVAAARDRLR